MILKHTSQKDCRIIGADETGVGDYFSPLIATAVYIPLENKTTVQALGLRDSKQIADNKILQLAQELKKYVYFQTYFLTQKSYNQLSKTYNAHELKMLLHLKNINTLTAKHEVDFCIIDKFSSIKKIYEYQKTLVDANLGLTKITTKLILEEKAENKYLEVAAASILARAFFLQKMQEQNKHWNFDFPFGASAKVDTFGKEFVKIHGLDNLKEVAKISFKNTIKITT